MSEYGGSVVCRVDVDRYTAGCTGGRGGARQQSVAPMRTESEPEPDRCLVGGATARPSVSQ